LPNKLVQVLIRISASANSRHAAPAPTGLDLVKALPERSRDAEQLPVRAAIFAKHFQPTRMKKFIAAFDPFHFTESTMAYAIYLAKFTNAHLVGIFLEDPNRHNYSINQLVRYEGIQLEQHVRALNVQEDENKTVRIEQFRKACGLAGIACSVHRDRDVPLQEMLQESIYADLLIISPAETLEHRSEQAPTHFIRELLEEVSCPVLLVPTNYRPMTSIKLLYDGEPGSVHALRMFSYLFEKMKSLPTEVITVRNEESRHLPAQRLIREFVKRHYPDAVYTILTGYPEEAIVHHLRRHHADPIIVLGAYRRNRLSRLFRPSMADLLYQALTQPLFIAHN
jgi:nucleotide-binding universal stress UspA family protein